MASGIFIDSRINADWLANFVQTNVYNVLLETNTKIPQTDAGMNILKTVMTQSLQQGVVNGYLAPGALEHHRLRDAQLRRRIAARILHLCPPCCLPA